MQLAVAVKDALQEMDFDAKSKSVLHLELAKKNLFVKRGITIVTAHACGLPWTC